MFANLDKKQSSGTEVHNYLEISTRDPLKYIMSNSILIVFICVGKILSECKGLGTNAMFQKD